MKFEIQNSNPDEQPAFFPTVVAHGRKTFWKFEFVSSFEFRVSSFGRGFFGSQQIHFRTLLLFLLLLATGCRRDMFNQPSSKPLEQSQFFRDNEMASRPLVPNTVARGQLREDEAFYNGKIGTNLLVVFPLPITHDVLLRGQERFNIYCSPCHGRTGEGNGMIPQRGFPPPPSYHIDRLRQAPVGHFFDVITHGYGVMYPYAARVEPRDRWAIAAYIRVLQASRNATIADVPEQLRAQLESPK
jgi:hypothetical protein